MPAMTFQQRYGAIASRDARWDGQFVTAVRTTGIYCRPSCPARTPKPGNVTFFASSAAALEAGYRACKRCVPEASPGSPDWDRRGDVVARAMRLIADGVVDRDGVDGLARRLGYSGRHLTRLIRGEVGAGPLALARVQRANAARALLVSTDMTATDIAFAAGFGSIRQFNDTIGEVFAMTPTQLRAARAPRAVPASLTLQLPVRLPFDHVGVFEWLADRAVEAVEVGDDQSFGRTIQLPGGPAWFEVKFDGQLRLRARLTKSSDLSALVSRVRRLFDLDADPLAIDEAMSVLGELADSVAACPGIRLLGAMDPDELLIRTMVGQQISVQAARTFLSQLTAQLGTDVTIDGQRRRLFPTMTAIAEDGLHVLRGPKARIRAIVAAAASLAAGDLELSVGDDPSAQTVALRALDGVGPWTADYMRMRVIGDPDVLLVSDLAVRHGARAFGIATGHAELRQWAQPSAPWRSYVSRHLWRLSQQRDTATAVRRPR